MIILVAIAGKIVGVMVTRGLTGFSFRQLYVVGWGMNSRGAVGLAIAVMAFKSGLLNEGLYSSIIMMTLVTTLIFPFFLMREVKKNRGIME